MPCVESLPGFDLLSSFRHPQEVVRSKTPVYRWGNRGTERLSRRLKRAASIPSPSFPDGAGQRGLTRPPRRRRGPRAPAPRADHSSTRLPGPGCRLLARSVSVGCERLAASGVVFVRSDVWGGDRSSRERLPDDRFVFASRTSLWWHSPGDGSPLAGPQMPLPSRLPARSGSVLLARRVEEQRGACPRGLLRSTVPGSVSRPHVIPRCPSGPRASENQDAALNFCFF